MLPNFIHLYNSFFSIYRCALGFKKTDKSNCVSNGTRIFVMITFLSISCIAGSFSLMSCSGMKSYDRKKPSNPSTLRGKGEKFVPNLRMETFSNKLELTTIHRCSQGVSSIYRNSWPLDRFWASNVVLANGILYTFYDPNQELKGIPCYQQYNPYSRNNKEVYLKDFLIHISPGQPNWGINFPSITVKSIPLYVDSTIPAFVCLDHENTIHDQVMVFGIRGFPGYGHIIFNTLHSIIGTLWEMGLDVQQTHFYAVVDEKPALGYNGMMKRFHDTSKSLSLDIGNYTQIFSDSTSDGILHNWLMLLSKSFQVPICFKNISFGHTYALDLYNKLIPPPELKRLQLTLLRVHGIPENHVKIHHKCQIRLVSRLSTRRVTNEDDFIAACRKRFPECYVDKIMFESLSLYEQAYEIHYRTTLLIGLDGTGLLNSIYLRPCSSVLRILPWGGEFLSLLDYPEYQEKGEEFRMVTEKVDCIWSSYSIPNYPNFTMNLKMNNDISRLIIGELEKHHLNATRLSTNLASAEKTALLDEIKVKIREQFPPHMRMEYWKNWINSELDDIEHFLDKVAEVMEDSKGCSASNRRYV